jgi:acetyltransferase-like isoleucine patch superfamily enzyme
MFGDGTGTPIGREVGRLAGDVVHAAWERVVRAGALGPRHRRARTFAHFGAGSLVAFPPTVIYGEGRISIGERTTIGPLASISAGMPSEADLRGDPIITIGDRWVSVGDGSWLGHGAVILPGSRIGKHVVVAAGAVVTGLDVPDRCVVAGVPARIVRRHVDGAGWVAVGRDGT